MSEGRGRGRASRPTTEEDEKKRNLIQALRKGNVSDDSSESTSSSSSSSSSSPSSGSQETGASAQEAAGGGDVGQVAASMSGLACEETPHVPKDEAVTIGSDGQVVDLVMNYVKVEVNKNNLGVHEYSVNFKPDIEADKLRFQVLRQPSVVAVIGTVNQYTSLNLFVPRRLPDATTVITATHPVTNEPLQVILRFVKVLQPKELTIFFNIAFKKIMKKLQYVQFQFSFFSPQNCVKLPQHNLELWPGYVQTIAEVDGGLLLNCESTTRVVRTKNCLDLMKDIRGNLRGGDFKAAISKAIVGTVVMTRYNNKPYRVDDISFSHKPTSEFPLSDGNTTTFVEYFRTRWNVAITDNDQPMFIHKPKPRKGMTSDPPAVILVPELCVQTGLNDEIRSDFRVMKDLTSHSRIKPAGRLEKLLAFLKNVRECPEAHAVLTDWGMDLAERPIVIKGRAMAPESIQLAPGSGAIRVNDKADWTRDVTSKRNFDARDLNNWALVFCERDGNVAREFFDNMSRVGQQMGMKFAVPKRFAIKSDGPAEYVNILRQATTETPDLEMIVVLTPGVAQREDRYNACKKFLCIDKGIPSQMVRAKTVSDPGKLRSVCQKIAIQINSKIGGAPWSIPIPFKSCMIIGLDVYHDTLQQKRSVVGFVASGNPGATSWYSRACFQEKYEEVANSINVCTVDALKNFHDKNKMLPDRIFFYRDGVSDGQIKTVRDTEIKSLKAALALFCAKFPEYNPKITYTIVQKRINTKMLLKVGQLPAGVDNPAPGTVLDHTVTKPEYWDFYLVSQHVNQGTVTPSHYIVLDDQNQMVADRMQKFTFRLTHLYYNWPGTIRVPAPCQNAHKLAYLCGNNIKREANPALYDKLFYL